MISDCDQRRSSIKSLRSASLVSSLFESATSIIHPLERLEPSVDIEFDSPGRAHSIFDTTHLSHAYKSTTSVATPSQSELHGSEQHKR
jgi:hypothetical protein